MLAAGSRLSDTILSFPVQGIDENGIEKTYRLEDFWGENIVLYFCPMDNSPDCTEEAFEFNKNLERIHPNAQVVCISPDSIAAHKKFQERLALGFILFSDTDYRLIKAFGAWGEKEIHGISVLGVIRSTFLIGKNGIIRHAWHNVKPEGHVEEVIKVLELLE